mgnify:CR=1 FL=1
MAEIEDFDEDQAEEFYDYVYSYYGPGGTFDAKLNLTRDDVKKYCDMYIADPTNKDLFPYQLCGDDGEGFIGVTGDTVDRQMVLSLIQKEHGLIVHNPHVPPPGQKHNLH